MGDTSTFDSNNPIVGSLIRELDVWGKKLASDLIKQGPNPPRIDFSLRSRLNKSKDRQELTDELSSPPSPPALPPGPVKGLGLPPPAPSRGFFEPFQPPPPRSDNSFGNFNIPVQQAPSFNNQKLSGNLFGSQKNTY